MRGRGRMPGWNLGGSVFDPATLPLTGWWRGSYSGTSPWVGTGSAGGSGSQNLTEATNYPAAGAAVNGFNPAAFDGVNKQLAGAAMSTFISASAYFWWALFYSELTGGSNLITSVNVVNNPGLWAEVTGGYIGSSFRNNGGTELVQVWHYDTGYNGNEHTISLNAWNLLCVRYDGTNLRSKLNSGSVLSTARGNVGNVTGTLNAGRNYNGFQKVRILDYGYLSTAESDARFDNIRSYANARYALSL